MSHLGTSSVWHLETCHPDLQRLARVVVIEYDCKVLEGFRGEDVQNLAFDNGLSKLRWPNSKHNKKPSEAIHIVPYPIDWGGPIVVDGKLHKKNLSALERFYHFGGYVQGKASELKIQLRWGGDWDRDFDLADQTFMDLAHFELMVKEGSV